jgi:hypothetical protein
VQTKQHPAETLEALARALRTTAPLGGAFYYDRQTRTVVPLIVDPEDLEDGPAPAWAEDEHALAESSAADPDRWHRFEETADTALALQWLAEHDG